jgi:hypothetical protein
MAAQVFYPDDYNGAIVNCPDPLDFRSYMTIDLYEDRNAYYAEGPFRRTARPGERDYLGRVRSTVEQQNLKELVLGTHSRSGGQWDIWEAVYSPVGSDGYPARIWDKLSGAIDPKVAQYWREHFDIANILKRDWSKLGPKLRGKLTINVGLSDNFYLNDAVYRVEDFLKTADPPAEASIARRALLERRSHDVQRRVASHRESASREEIRRALDADGAEGRRRHVVEILTARSPRSRRSPIIRCSTCACRADSRTCRLSSRASSARFPRSRANRRPCPTSVGAGAPTAGAIRRARKIGRDRPDCNRTRLAAHRRRGARLSSSRREVDSNAGSRPR